MRRIEHELKTWPTFWEDVFTGRKNFELRINDRDFMIGDILVLKEYDPTCKEYTGRLCRREIMYVLNDKDIKRGLQQGYCILGLKPIIERVLKENLEMK